METTFDFGMKQQAYKADFQSDVDAINIYERMRKNNESSLNNTWIEYYREVEIGNINRTTEFFCNLGNGDEGIGIIGLSNILEKKTYRSEYIQRGNNMSEEKIDEYSNSFVKWFFSEYYGYEYKVLEPN